jgi:hypothetical protein
MEALLAFENVNPKSQNEMVCFRDRSLPTLPYNRPYRGHAAYVRAVRAVQSPLL